MTKKLLSALFITIYVFLSAQVGIGTDQPHPKSILDIAAENGNLGVLFPRLTTNEINAIAPASGDIDVDGLWVYNTDTKCYNYWNSQDGQWMELCENSENCDPSTFADFSIDCTQFPAADSNSYVVDQTVTGNTITVLVNVTKLGPYSITITSDNGVSYATSSEFTSLGNQSVLVNTASGAPNSSTLNFTVRGNGVTLCNYTKTANSNFSYKFNCPGATVSPTMVQGVYSTGTVNVPITVNGTGNIPAINQTINGVTYVYAGVVAATSATTNISITYSGTPTTSSSILSLTNSDSSTCNVTILHPASAAAFTCETSAGNSATPNGTFIVGQALTNQTVTLTVLVSTIGSYPTLTYTGGGMIFTAPAGNFSSTGNKTIVLNGSGTPANVGLNSLIPNTTGMCPLSINVEVGNATYNNCTVVEEGNFTVATALTSSERLRITLTGATPGKLRFVSENKNGIKFDSGEIIIGSGTQVVYLNSVAALFPFPMTAEEENPGANGADNQESTYTITNTTTGAVIPCSAQIDVKPRVWVTNHSLSGTSVFNGASNGNVSMHMIDQSTQLGFPLYYKVWVQNNTSTNWTNVSTRTRSYYEQTYLLSWDNGTINPGYTDRLGSLDGYLQAATSPHRPNFTGENGAHAGPATGGEVSDNGLTFRWTAPASGNLFSTLGTKYYKYRVVYYSRPSGTTDMRLILLGIYDNQPETYVPPTGMTISEQSGGNLTYWP